MFYVFTLIVLLVILMTFILAIYQRASLEQLFRDGRHISPILEYWLNENTNLIYISGNKQYDFIHENNSRYQLKTFTKNGMSFRPSNQIGSGRFSNQKDFENYCNTQTFVIASVVKFPVVKFKLVSGKYLLKTFPNGKIKPKEHDIIFPF